MTSKKEPAKFVVRLNIHDHNAQHAWTNCDNMSWAGIKRYINTLSKIAIPADSCLYDIDVEAREIRSLTFSKERASTFTYGIKNESHPTPQTLVHINMTGHKNCGDAHCLDNLAAGRCLDAYVIRTIGKKFFADKYTKTK